MAEGLDHGAMKGPMQLRSSLFSKVAIGRASDALSADKQKQSGLELLLQSARTGNLIEKDSSMDRKV